MSKRTCDKTGKRKFHDEGEAKRALARIVQNPDPDIAASGHLPSRYYRCEHCGQFHLTSQERRDAEYRPGNRRAAPTHQDLTPDEESENDRLLLEGIVRRCIADKCGTCMHDPDWGLYRIRRELAPPKSTTTSTNHEGDAP